MSRDLERMRREHAAFGQHVERAIWAVWGIGLILALLIVAVLGIGVIWLARTVL